MATTITDEHDSAGLSLLAGSILGLVLIKEIFRRIGEMPLLAGARHTSRAEKAFSLALVLRGIERIGASVLRSTGA